MSSRGVDSNDSRSGGPDRRSWRGGGVANNRSTPYPPRRSDDKSNNSNWRGGGGGGGGRGGAHRGGGRDMRRDGPPVGRGGYRGGGGGGDHHQYRQQQHRRGGPRHQQYQQQPNRQEEQRIDRTRICPLMLRVFIQKGSHHSSESFAIRGEEPTEDSILIYTWMDASLRELAELIQVVNQDARQTNVNLSFAFVYPDRNGDSTLKHVHTIPSFRDNTNRLANQMRVQRSQEDRKTLKDLKFETGDFLSVAILQEEELEFASEEKKEDSTAAEAKESKSEESASTPNEATTTAVTTPHQLPSSDSTTSAAPADTTPSENTSIPPLENA